MPVESRRSPARQPLPDPIAGLLPRLFIALALLVGTAYVVLIPPLQVPMKPATSSAPGPSLMRSGCPNRWLPYRTESASWTVGSCPGPR